MGRVDKLVATLFVSLARVVLHDPADDPTLWMEDRQAGANLVREAKQVKLDTKLAVVTTSSLFEPGHVGLKLLRARPGGAINALQLLVLLVATPIRRGRTQQRESFAYHAGVR